MGLKRLSITVDYESHSLQRYKVRASGWTPVRFTQQTGPAANSWCVSRQ